MTDPQFYETSYEKLLPHFIEECGEALAAAGKTLRWGLDSCNPLLPEDQQELNMDWLLRELDDVLQVGNDLRTVLVGKIYHYYNSTT